MRIGIVFVLVLCIASLVSAQQSPDQRLTACQEQLADVYGAVAKVFDPISSFRAVSVVTLDRKLGEAQQQQARDAATISALRKELEALKQPTSTPGDTRGPDTPAARE